MLHRMARSDSSSWWRGCPFQAIPPKTELTTAVLAGSFHHPNEQVRAGCAQLLTAAVGPDALRAALDGVRHVLEPHQCDALEPMDLTDEDFRMIALIQLLSSIGGGRQNPVLRVTSRNAMDLAGGIELVGTSACKRIDRRRGADWNIPQGSAYHPTLLAPWVEASAVSGIGSVRSETVRLVASIRIPNVASSMLDLQKDLYELRSSPGLGEYRQWLFGPNVSGKRVSENEVIASSIQRHARMIPAGPTLSSIGGVVAVGLRDTLIRFSTPESILRLAAIAASPGAMQLAALRPWGWLLFGRGEDQICFIKSAHALPPRWAQVTLLPAMDVPPELIQALSRWIGPFAGHVTLELLESFR